MKTVDIIIPIFNEEKTIDEIVKRVEMADFAGLYKNIIFVNDCSCDSSLEVLKKYEGKYKIISHKTNMGKGAAVYTGFLNSSSDFVVIQDADLEYDPSDYGCVLQVLLNDEADVCYGSRFLEMKLREGLSVHYFGNKFLTLVTNILYGSKITDMETCYKAFKREFIKDLVIKSKKFDFEPEITAKILKRGARIKEVPISYNGRKYSEGKKITCFDGFAALAALLKFRFTN